MNTKYLVVALSICLAAGWVRAEDKKELTDKRDKTSYSMGYNIGSNWKRQQGMETNDLQLETLARGIRDAMAGQDSIVPDLENKELITAFQAELKTRRDEKRKQLAEKNKKEGEAFLAENKTKPDVHVLPDGLQYKILTEGKGPKPTTNDSVTVNYRGTLIDGTEFDSSAKHGGKPSTFKVTGVIPGWTEALQQMPVGSKWQLFVPSELAYRERGMGMNIGPNATLIFEMELVSVQPPAQPVPNIQQQPVTSDIIKVPSAEDLKKGAQVEIIKPDQLEKERQKEQEKAKQQK